MNFFVIPDDQKKLVSHSASVFIGVSNVDHSETKTRHSSNSLCIERETAKKLHCKESIQADASCVGPVSSGANSQTNEKHDYIQRDRTEWQAPLALIVRLTRLQLYRPQPRGQMRNQASALVWWRIDIDLIFLARLEKTEIVAQNEDQRRNTHPASRRWLTDEL